MARKTCYDLVHKLQFKFTLSGRYTTNIYVRDSSARSVFLSFVSALKIPAMKTSKNLFIPFPFVPPIGSFTYFRQFENSSDNHHCIGFKSSFSSFFSYFSKAKLWGWIIRCSLFTTLFFKKSVLFDLCQKIRPYT